MTQNKDRSVRKKRRTIHPVSQEKYDTIKALVLSTFKVKTCERTRVQNNAITQFYRSPGVFEVKRGKLFYNNKEIIRQKTVQNIVKKYFNQIHGCGARPLAQRLRRNYHGITERKVRGEYIKSLEYHRVYPKFTNSSTLRSITANRINERWQIDLMDMINESVSDEGKDYRYILSVLDVFSRFLVLKPLESKASKEVARELEKIFADRGKPETVQCDQGNEFKGKTEEFLISQDVNIIRSRPYPQSQGKCERSHLTVRKKITFLNMKKKGFNWARDLHKVQRAINETPKEVLANFTPFEVVTGNDAITTKVTKASKRCVMRTMRSRSKHQYRTSVYEVGETVLFRFPPKGRVPKKRYILVWRVAERNVKTGRYKLTFTSPSGSCEENWINVEDITSMTVQREQDRKKTAGKILHRMKYLIPMTEDNRMSTLDVLGNNSVVVQLNPTAPGSCQFESVADQLREYGIHRSHEHLRQEAVNHLRNHLHHYHDFITGDTQQYLARMEKNTEYGDHLTLIALAREYNVQFLIVSNRGLDHTSVVSNDGKLNDERLTLTLGHFPEHHYVSVYVAVDTVGFLKHYMAPSTETDNADTDRIVECNTEDAFKEIENRVTQTDTHNSDKRRNRQFGYADEDRENQYDVGDEDREVQFDVSDEDTEVQFDVSDEDREDEYDVGDEDREVQFDVSDEDTEVQFDVSDEDREVQFDVSDNDREVQFDVSDEDTKVQFDVSDEDREVHFDVNDVDTEVQFDVSEEDREVQFDVSDEDREVHFDVNDEDTKFQFDASDEDREVQFHGGDKKIIALDNIDTEDRDGQIDYTIKENTLGNEKRRIQLNNGEHTEDCIDRRRNNSGYITNSHPYLPPEILTIIIKKCLSNDPNTRYSLIMVNKLFQQVVNQVPLPEINISPQILLNVPMPVSVRRLVRVAGRYSGLVLEIRSIIRNSRWYNAWLHLLEIDNRWFRIRYIWWRRR